MKQTAISGLSLLRKIVRKLRGPRHHARKTLEREIAHGEPEIRLIPVLADRAGTFVDVGANQGSYALCALPHFSRVVAVEAHPDLARWLKTALGPRCEVIHTALSDAVGAATLHVPVLGDSAVMTRCSLNEDANPGFDLRSVEVPMTSLDHMALDKVRVIKIDVEGHELAVLRGARATIARCQPVCIVECEERHNTGGIDEAFSFFRQLGYAAWFVHRGALRPGSEFGPALLQRAENAKPVSGGRSPDYVNNFIFVPADDTATVDRLRAVIGGWR